jgi:hypothetical protein
LAEFLLVLEVLRCWLVIARSPVGRIDQIFKRISLINTGSDPFIDLIFDPSNRIWAEANWLRKFSGFNKTPNVYGVEADLCGYGFGAQDIHGVPS